MQIRVFLTATLVLCLAAHAWAHGGDYRQPARGPGGGGPKFGPDTGDAAAGRTRWESWWASNKEYYLRFSSSFRDQARSQTPGGTEGGAGPDGITHHPPPDPAAGSVAAELRTARLLPVFLDALTSPHEEVRASAAIAIGKTQDPRAVDPLRLAAKKDGSVMVRESALIALGLLGRQELLPDFDEILNQSDIPTRHRCFAAFGLGLTGGEQAAGCLMRFAISDLGPSRPAGTRAMPKELTASVFVALGLAGGSDTPEFLRQALTSEHYDLDLKPYVVLSLGRVADVASRDALVKMLIGHADAGMRRAAAVALGKIGKRDDILVTESLLAALDRDKDPLTRHFAAVALGEIDGLEVRDQLRRLLEKGDTHVRPFAALALGRLHDAGSAPTIRALLAREPIPSTRSSFCLALGLIGDKEAASLLEAQFTQTRSSDLKGYAALSLGLLGNEASGNMLYDALDASSDTQTSVNCALALGMLGDRRVVDYLRVRITGRPSNMTAPAAVVTGLLRIAELERPLVAAVRSPASDEVVIAHAIVALGMLADPSPIPKLSGLSIGHDYSLELDPLREVLSIF